ncbi:hypothetical protein [uncultured Clostridium sp.]|jgi:hypothetical protein|uniref:hypothetical protein n=1 Tax=uncultured Clostridium sp. TaxID=59620 RepID=UPI002638B7B3|nr:hypothetical protein [uncultured Clostridium sp.]
MKLCTQAGISSIEGDSPTMLKDFFEKFGAKYECRTPKDSEVFYNKFYIDLLKKDKLHNLQTMPSPL